MATDKFDWSAQLVMLRGMTKRLGVLHEAQCLQLRLWPFSIDPTLEKSEAKVDLESKRVDFVWTGSTLKVNKKYQTRLKALKDNVKFLLGDDWSITVTLDGAAISLVDTNGKSSNRSRTSKRKPKRPNRQPKRSKRKPARKGRR